jgi:HK97 family phage portal protein
MSFIGRTLAATNTVIIPFSSDNTDPFFHRHGAGGIVPHVSPDRAMAIPAVYACTTVVSEDIAKVPLQMFQQGENSKDIARNHPIYDLLHDQPNDYQTAIEFREMMTAFALNRDVGGVAEIIPGPRGPVDQLIPLHPDLLTRETRRVGQAGAKIIYVYSDPIRGTRELTSDEVFVLRGRFGRSVLSYARESFALQLAMQRFASQAYTRGPRHTGVISRPKEAPKWTENARSNFREAIDEYMGEGERAGRPMLLEDGMTWASAGITMRDAEFLATMQHGVADVCRFYRVPQHKVQELLRSTNNNIEQQSIDYVTDSLVAWAVRWEQAIRRDLIIAKKTYFAEHNLDGLLRGDSKTRSEAYSLAIMWGWMTRAEVRQRENLNPIAGLEEPLTPGNMIVGADGVPRTMPGSSASMPSSPAVVSHLRLFVRDAASRVVRKETASLTKLAERTGGTGDEWRTGVRALYVEHAEFVSRLLRIPDASAERYCQRRAEHFVEMGPFGLDDFETATVEMLTAGTLERAGVVRDLMEITLEENTMLRLPEPAAA